MELCRKGQKSFENRLMQFFDISGMVFDDINFKNCSLFFCTFRNCSFRNVAFDDCTVYSGSFYTGAADGLIFENCELELTLFDSFQFSRTSMKKCRMQWCGIMNSNHVSVDLSTSSSFKTITDLSQVTPADIEYIISVVMGKVERLDMDMRLKVKEIIRADIERYKLKNPEEKQGKYSSAGTAPDAPLTYGEARGMVEGFFYGTQSPYKTKKHPYETSGGYKK